MLGPDDFTVGEVLTVVRPKSEGPIRTGDRLRVDDIRATGLGFYNERSGNSWGFSYRWVTRNTTQDPLRIVESWVDRVRT